MGAVMSWVFMVVITASSQPRRLFINVKMNTACVSAGADMPGFRYGTSCALTM